jgi:hypothetical protein
MPSTQSTTLEVIVDPRVELLATIFRLAGADEYDGGSFPRYAADVQRHFAPFKDHPAVEMAKRLRATRGISYDAVMSFAIHLTDFPALEPLAFERSELDSRWTASDAAAFAPLVRDFALASHADRYFAAHEDMYRAAVKNMRTVLDAEVDAGWFGRFFGPQPLGSRMVVVVAPQNGGIAYGVRFMNAEGQRQVYAIMNVMETDSSGTPLFSAAYLPTIIHEVAHSFVNPVVDARVAELAGPATAILGFLGDRMKQQGYTEPRTMVSESLVRASVARYLLERHGAVAAQHELESQEFRSFVWIDDIFALLGTYERARPRYPTFNAFFSNVAAYYADLAPRISTVDARAQEVLALRRPHVVAMTPANGSPSLDPSTSTISFQFDRAMAGSHSTMLLGPQGRERYPATSAASWDSTHTIFTMRVSLRPAWKYEFTLNRGENGGFLSADGIALKEYRVTFTTAAQPQ